MDYCEYPAPPDLAPFVRCFWSLEGSLPPGATERVLPDGRQELIAHLADPFDQLDPAGNRVRQPRALFAGQIDGPLVLQPTGAVAMFGVCFHPGGAFPFSRWGQQETTGRIFSLEEVWGADGRAFSDRIRECSSHQKRCELAANLLRLRLRPDHAAHRIAAAIQRIQREPWQRIDTQAASTCLSPRHFERLFLQHVGLPPKTFASIVRFQHVLRTRDRQPDWTWARVALEAGYFDQAHLIADFRRFSGSTPTWHESDWTAMERAFVRPA